MLLAFANLIRHAIAVGQFFACQNPPLAILAFYQPLVKHHQQVVCQLHANLLLTLGRKNINNPVDRHNRVVSVHTAQHQVTGISRLQGNGDTLMIAHLTDHDNVRSLAEDMSQTFMESFGVQTDFTLVDVTVLVTMQVLNRVFNGNNISRFFSVDQIDQSRKGCRLAMPVGPVTSIKP